MLARNYGTVKGVRVLCIVVTEGAVTPACDRIRGRLYRMWGTPGRPPGPSLCPAFSGGVCGLGGDGGVCPHVPAEHGRPRTLPCDLRGGTGDETEKSREFTFIFYNGYFQPRNLANG